MSILNSVLAALGGKPPGFAAVEKWGRNVNIQTADTFQVIWPYAKSSQDYIFIDSPISLFMVSDNASDTLLGTGAQTVSWLYQDNNGIEKRIVLETNGTTNVPLPTTSYGVFVGQVETSGTGNKNAGNLDIVDGSGNKYARIVAGEGRTQIAVYRIPNNVKEARIKQHIVKFSGGSPQSNCVLGLYFRKIDGTILLHWPSELSATERIDEKNYPLEGKSPLPGEWVYWVAESVGTNGTKIEASFDIQLQYG